MSGASCMGRETSRLGCGSRTRGDPGRTRTDALSRRAPAGLIGWAGASGGRHRRRPEAAAVRTSDRPKNSGEIDSSSSATFCRTSCSAMAPGMTLLTAGCASTNCSAAAGSVTPWSRHALSILRTRSMMSGGAG